MSHVTQNLGEDVYIGYSLHFTCDKSYRKVETHLSLRASKVAKFRYKLTRRPLEKFLFLKATPHTTKNAVLCFIRREDVLKRHNPKVCFHKDESTVVAGLGNTMVMATARPDCNY